MLGSDSRVGFMYCWKCGTRVEHTPHSKFSRKDTCHHCDIDLHVCKNCKFHDPTVHNQCRETQAEWVSKKERANFCDYFVPSELRIFDSTKTDSRDSRSAFDSLFKD